MCNNSKISNVFCFVFGSTCGRRESATGATGGFFVEVQDIFTPDDETEIQLLTMNFTLP